jgi:hypothetical protein
VETTVISALAALAGVLLGGVLARNAEYRRWLRTERHKAAAELLAAGQAMQRNVAERFATTLPDRDAENADQL